MADARAAIVMVRRDEAGNFRIVDAGGKEHGASTAVELRAVIDAVLDDPSVPQVEQVAHLETMAEQILIQATASLLPQVAKPLAGPLVRDAALVWNKFATFTEGRRAQKGAREPLHERSARRRASRIRSSKVRLGESVKRKGTAA